MLKVKITGVALGAALAFGAFAPMAGAVTVAELQAQLNALLAQLAAMQGGGATAASISSDLTVGSKGGEVVTLQDALIAQGYLHLPNGVAKGYFGSLTKAAVKAWQTANGLPSTGYFGPLSRARFTPSNAQGNVPGSTVGSGSGGSITTPGVEGTVTVSLNPTPASAKVYEGASKVPVLGIKLEAKTSDIKIERVKLDLDESGGTNADTDLFRKIASKIYLMDGSTVLASMDLNNDTVVKDGSDYFVTLSGFGYVVPKNSTRVLTVALDARSNWDTAFDGDTWTMGVPAEGVRGVDGAGVNQYGPSTAFSRSFTSEGELAESATLTVSTNSGTPQDQAIVCASGTSENECDGVELLKVDFKAEKDNVTLTDLVVDVVRTGSGSATTTTGYLVDSNGTVIGSDSIDTDTHSGFTFSDIDYVIPKDSTKTLTLKVDIDSAGGTATIFTADVDTADVTSENANGTAITESGTAQGESITVRNVGVQFSLVSKSISRIAPAGFAGATSSAQADFVIRMKAVGSAIEFGDAGSTTFRLAGGFPTSAAGTSTIIYRGGSSALTDGITQVSSSTSITVPAGVTAAGGANSWVLAEGNTVDIPMSFVFQTRWLSPTTTEITYGSYQVGLERLNWLSSVTGHQSDTFMATNAAWITSAITLP